jgi:hypothetical protein
MTHVKRLMCKTANVSSPSVSVSLPDQSCVTVLNGSVGQDLESQTSMEQAEPQADRQNDTRKTVTVKRSVNSISADYRAGSSRMHLKDITNVSLNARAETVESEVGCMNDEPYSGPKCKRRRWNDTEKKMLFETFGGEITSKKMPSEKELNEFARKLSNSRTEAQIRTQLHNFMSGKNNSFP